MKKAEDDPEDDVEESIFDGQKEIESAELREIFFFFFFFFKLFLSHLKESFVCCSSFSRKTLCLKRLIHW